MSCRPGRTDPDDKISISLFCPVRRRAMRLSPSRPSPDPCGVTHMPLKEFQGSVAAARAPSPPFDSCFKPASASEKLFRGSGGYFGHSVRPPLSASLLVSLHSLTVQPGRARAPLHRRLEKVRLFPPSSTPTACLAACHSDTHLIAIAHAIGRCHGSSLRVLANSSESGLPWIARDRLA